MFREMRRSAQALPEEVTLQILKDHHSGVLSVNGDDGYPYGMPISYVYADGKICFHGSAIGHRMDALRACDKASFAVVDQDEIDGEKNTNLFRSVICFGRVKEVEGPEERLKALTCFCDSVGGFVTDAAKEGILSGKMAIGIFAMEIEHVTGKEQRLLAAARKEAAQQ